MVIELGPLPDDEYNIEISILKRLYKVIDANDILPIPTQFLEAVRNKAIAEVLYIHDSQKAQI